jgi:hypothetical protein
MKNSIEVNLNGKLGIEGLTGEGYMVDRSGHIPKHYHLVQLGSSSQFNTLYVGTVKNCWLNITNAAKILFRYFKNKTTEIFKRKR